MASAKMASSDSRLNCCESTTCFSLVLCHEVAVSECEFVLIALTRPAAARRLAAGRATAVRMHCCAACCRRALVWRPEPRSDWCCMGLLMHSLRALITGKSTLFRVTRDYSVCSGFDLLFGACCRCSAETTGGIWCGLRRFTHDAPAAVGLAAQDISHKGCITTSRRPQYQENGRGCIITVLLQNHSSPPCPRFMAQYTLSFLSLLSF